VSAFAEAVSQRPKDVKADADFEHKMASRHVEPLVQEPKGQEIKHDWLWKRMGAWFQDTGAFVVFSNPSLASVPA
jgi:pyruvate decarboxylase